MLRFSFRMCLMLAALLLSVSFAFAQTIAITVEPGDQLGTISQRYLIKPATAHLQELAALNKLSPPYTLNPGATLLLPARLLASHSAPATWLAVTGDVKIKKTVSGDAVLAAVGGLLREGDEVVLGSDASALVRLADGSEVKLLAGTRLVMAEHRYYAGRAPLPVASSNAPVTKAFSGLLRLIQGSVETRATQAQDRAKPLRIQTPTSVVGVRGTQFRVGVNPAVDVASSTTRTEVIEGRVKAQLDERRQAAVEAGFGVVLDPRNASLPVPQRLLPAPDLTAWRMAQDRTVLEFGSLPTSVQERAVASYRVQVAKLTQRDHAAAAQDSFAQIVFDKVFGAAMAVRIPDLADGRWRIRVRAIDAAGLEGFATTVTAVLRARPEPPLLQSPAAAAKIVETETVHLVWAARRSKSMQHADSYAVELVDSQGVARVLDTQRPFVSISNLPAGVYRWRVATRSVVTQIRADTFSGLQLGGIEQGPWGDAQTLTVVALPDNAKAQLSDADKRALVIRWPDQKAASYEVQLSRSESFAAQDSGLMTYSTQQPSVIVQNPVYGAHFVRYRAIERDGFVGGWSGTSKVEVAADWQMLLMYLGGGLKTWP